MRTIELNIRDSADAACFIEECEADFSARIDDGIKPLSIRVGNIYYSDRMVPARVNVTSPAL